MIKRAVRERLRDDVAVWFLDGVIDETTRDVLLDRYEAANLGWVGVIKYIGVTGGLLAFFGILGMITAMAESELLAVLVLGGTGAALTAWGLKLACDLRDGYGTSSRMVLTLGVMQWCGAVGLLLALSGLEEGRLALTMGCICLPICFTLAYRYRNMYLLVLSLLGFFHWIGSWHAMWGDSTYVFSVQDPKTMSVVALGAVALGLYHERYLYPGTGRFYVAWEALGLLYLNMSLLILSIWGHAEADTLAWIVVFTVAGIAQIVLGAAWQNALLRNFGVAFYCINVFTRYHEFFWERIDIGWFFLFGGCIVLAVGVATEVFVRQVRAKGGAVR